MDFSMTSTQLEFYEYGRQLASRYDRNYWLEKVAAREFPQEMWKTAPSGLVSIVERR